MLKILTLLKLYIIVIGKVIKYFSNSKFKGIIVHVNEEYGLGLCLNKEIFEWNLRIFVV